MYFYFSNKTTKKQVGKMTCTSSEIKYW